MWNTRPDADLVTDVHPYRRMMLHLMPGRNESVFYFHQRIDLTGTLAFVEEWNAAHPQRRITPFHVVVWAGVHTLEARPQMNRFVANGKMWQRRGIWMSYMAKKEMSDEGGAATLKREFDPEATFADIVDQMFEDVTVGRSDEETHIDKEMALFLRVPGPLLRVGVRAVRLADALGLLPRSFVDPDPMFTSIFLANLGSIKLDAGHHHLFEYGNCPIFGVVGQIQDLPVVIDGDVVVRPTMSMRWSYDERVADGLYAQRALQLFRRMVEDPVGHGIDHDDLPEAAPRGAASRQREAASPPVSP